MSNEIKLRKFEVELKTYGENEGKYMCQATFTHGRNRFTIHLDNNVGDKLVHICKDEIAKSSQDALDLIVIAAKGKGND